MPQQPAADFEDRSRGQIALELKDIPARNFPSLCRPLSFSSDVPRYLDLMTPGGAFPGQFGGGSM